MGGTTRGVPAEGRDGEVERVMGRVLEGVIELVMEGEVEGAMGEELEGFVEEETEEEAEEEMEGWMEANMEEDMEGVVEGGQEEETPYSHLDPRSIERLESVRRFWQNEAMAFAPFGPLWQQHQTISPGGKFPTGGIPIVGAASMGRVRGWEFGGLA